MAIGIYNAASLGRGFGTEAIKLLLDHAFGTMELHRIAIRVLAYNGRREQIAHTTDESKSDGAVSAIIGRTGRESLNAFRLVEPACHSNDFSSDLDDALALGLRHFIQLLTYRVI